MGAATVTQAAVRSWLADTLSDALGLDAVSVHDSLFKSAPAEDMLVFLSFASEEEQLTFGDVGALYQATYQPELLLLLIDAQLEDAQQTLDRYTNAVRRVLRRVHGPIALYDTDTGETSNLILVKRQVGIRAATVDEIGMATGVEGNAIASVVISPNLVETFIHA